MCRKHIPIYMSRKHASCRGPLFLLSDTMNVKYGHHLKISFPICQLQPIKMGVGGSHYYANIKTPKNYIEVNEIIKLGRPLHSNIDETYLERKRKRK